MNYKFPVIEHIDQVREAIKGRIDFDEYDKGEYTVFNYFLPMPDAFNDPIRRELRGLIFDKNGKVLSRRFHKFFNYGEREETLDKNINWCKPHTILEKLDGSMVTPLILPSGIRWATKMGITDTSVHCENYFKDDKTYLPFIEMCYELELTPIFEFTSPINRIVLQYNEPTLTLLAIRHNKTGQYFKYETLWFLANSYNISVVQPYLMGSIDELRNKTDIEGVVVRFDDGHMIKVKTDWYCSLHKFKENLLFEKNVIKIILEEKIDDLLPNLPDMDRDRLLKFQKELLKGIDFTTALCENIIAKCNGNLTRKEFALKVAPTLHSFVKNICYSCWDDFTKVKESVVENIIKKCNSQPNVDSIRDVIGCKWDIAGG